MPASRPAADRRAALRLIPGDASPCVVTLGMAVAAVRACERQIDAAVDSILDAPTTDAVLDAAQRLNAGGDRLTAARNRRDRLIAETGGDPWLWLAACDGEVVSG